VAAFYGNDMISVNLKDLYPQLNDEELAIAADNLDRYLELAWEILQEPSTDKHLEADNDKLYDQGQGRPHDARPQ